MAAALHALLLLRLLSLSPRTVAAADVWSNQAVLAADGSVRIKWNIHDGNFTCQLEADTLGWVAFGLSPNGAMKNSDMIVAGVKDGRPYLMDMNSQYGYQLTVDERQDYHLLAAWETDNTTVVVFTRRLTVSCQAGHRPNEDRDITEDTQNLLYAYHSLDPEEVSAPQRHQHRGQRSLHLTDPAAPPPDAQQDGPVATWTARQIGAVLPSRHTVYWCQVLRPPPLDAKAHVIKYSPAITPGNERVVHHMIMYQCSGRDFSGLAEHADRGGGYECYSANMPPAAALCRGIIAGWGVGGEDFSFPPGVGYPIGPTDGSQFYILETHYDLVGKTAVPDSSGLQLTLALQPRPVDASMITLGHDVSPLLMVPPGQKQMTVAGHCSDECLDLALPREGVTVFAALPHTHLLGHQIRLRHFRRGRELAPILRDDSYDFNYQQLRHVPPRRLLPGDQLTVECVYRSTERSNVTLGGQSTQEEMCNMFVQYYPAIQLAQCVSAPRAADVLGMLGISKVSRQSRRGTVVIEAPAAHRGVSLQEYLDQLQWTDSKVDALQSVIRDGVHVPECYEFGRHVLSTKRNTTQYPAGAKKQGWLHRAAICEETKGASEATSRAAAAETAALLVVAALLSAAVLR